MDKLIASITKNTIDEVRMSLTEYKGHTYVDVRVYTELDGGKDKVPTKKGITVRPDLLARPARGPGARRGGSEGGGVVEVTYRTD